MKKIFLIISIALFVCIPNKYSFAQTSETEEEEKPIVEYINGSKYIHIDRLYLSPSMTVWEFLNLFPELSYRGSEDVLNNYSIVMDDYSLGVNRDEVLFQMTLGELEMIIITDNPSVTYTNDGVGGVVTLIPKSIVDGISGNAQLGVSTEKNVLSSASVNYKKDKLRIRSYIKTEYVDFTDRYNMTKISNGLQNYYEHIDNTRAASELIKFSMEYSASEKDEISFSIWETYGYKVFDNNYKETYALGGFFNNNDTINTDGVNTLSRFAYTHTFSPKHSLSLGINYSFSDTRQEQGLDTTYSQPHGLAADLRYTGILLNSEKHKLVLASGADFDSNLSKTGRPSSFATEHITVSPLLELHYHLSNKFYARVGARYHYDYHYAANSPTKLTGNDYMVSSEFDYTPKKGHTIRLSDIRDRICSDEGLRLGYIASGDLSYIFQKYFNRHYLNISAGFQYDHASMNSGNIYNIYAAKFATTWQHKFLCLSFTTHIFDNETLNNSQVDYKLYYCIRLTPIITLKKSWSISMNFIYNSNMISSLSVDGDYFFTSIRFSKKINQRSVCAEFSDPFHYQTTNKDYNLEAGALNATLIGIKEYHPYHRFVSVGIMYEF